MKALVTGGGGFLGKAIVKLLRERGDEVRSFSRNPHPALTEMGEMVKGRGDTPNKHDILTGSTPDGRAFPAGADKTCSMSAAG